MDSRSERLVYPAPSRTRRSANGLPFDAALTSYARALYAENKSRETIERVYVPRLRAFAGWLSEQGMPTTLEGIHREHVEAFVLYLQISAPGRKQADRPGQQPATVSIAFRTIRGFFSWCVEDDLLPRSPMEKMHAPSVPEEPVPVLRDADMERLLKATTGAAFDDRRDTALLRLMYDTGMRRGEIAALVVDDIDWTYNVVHVGAQTSKSKRGRSAPFGRKAARALDRYVRARAQHPYAEEPWLWLGKRGRFGASGLLQMVERRGQQAGMPGLHPHLFRHSFAHNLKAAGMSSEDVMMLGGWRDPGVMARYGRGAAVERAVAAYAHVAPGDRVG